MLWRRVNLTIDQTSFTQYHTLWVRVCSQHTDLNLILSLNIKFLAFLLYFACRVKQESCSDWSIPLMFRYCYHLILSLLKSKNTVVQILSHAPILLDRGSGQKHSENLKIFTRKQLFIVWEAAAGKTISSFFYFSAGGGGTWICMFGSSYFSCCFLQMFTV